EQCDDAQRRTAEAWADGKRVVHPDVSAADARRGELRIVRGVLTAMRSGDERTAAARTREDNVAWLVADEKRADHAWVTEVRHVNDRHGVREVVDDPHLTSRPLRHG